MLRGFVLEETRCYNHSHRIVETRCSRCRTPYCDECLVQVPPDERPPPPRRWPWRRQLPEPDPPDAPYCAVCANELRELAAAAREARRPLWQRRPSRATLGWWLLGLVIAALVLVPSYFLADYITRTPLTPGEIARIQVGLNRGFTTLEGVDILSAVYGGQVLRTNVASQPGHEPQALLDTLWQTNVPDWRSAEAQFPVEFVFQAALRSSMGKLILRVRPDSPPESWPREFELLISDTSPNTGYQSVLRATFDRREAERMIQELKEANRRPEDLVPAPLRFTFPEVNGRYVMLRILSNHGYPKFTSLAEVEVYPAESPL